MISWPNIPLVWECEILKLREKFCDLVFVVEWMNLEMKMCAKISTRREVKIETNGSVRAID